MDDGTLHDTTTTITVDATPVITWKRFDVADAEQAGYARATADIVEWLRNEAATGPFYAAPLNDTANAIERGDFRKVTA